MAATRGTVRFGVDARHIRQLGQELVGDRTTALTEMVKNAYDADATQVALWFEEATRRTGGTIEVRDDGSGMTLDDLKRGWMRISTPIKDEEPVSPKYRRSRAGRKGIGRFATETLGRRLRLETTVEGDPRLLIVDFDWENDYPPGTDLHQIANRYRYVRAPKEAHGTLLRIEGLYDVWDEPARNRVNRAVRLLRPPFPVARVVGAQRADPGFSLQVEIDGVSQGGDADDYDEFLAAATAELEIRAGRRIELHLTSRRFDMDETIRLPIRLTPWPTTPLPITEPLTLWPSARLSGQRTARRSRIYTKICWPRSQSGRGRRRHGGTGHGTAQELVRRSDRLKPRRDPGPTGELEPLVSEKDRLERALAALEGLAGPRPGPAGRGPAPTDGRRRPRGRPTRGQASGGRAPRGARRRELLVG